MTMPDTQGASRPGREAESDRPATEGARGQMRQVRQQVVDQAKSSFRQARDRATSSLADSRRQAADQMGGVANALHSAGRHLRDERQDRIAGLADGVANQVDHVAAYLRGADLQRVVRDLEDLARRRPALVFGAAFALGLVGARFLKTSERGGDRYGHEEYGGSEAIRPEGYPAGLGLESPGDVSSPPRTMGGRDAGA